MIFDAASEIRTLLATSMGSRCKKYYVGRPFVPAKSALPALVVTGVKTKLTRPNTAQDRYQFTLRITLIQDMAAAQDVAGLTNGILVADNDLQKAVEEADTDGAPKADTLLGTLMKQSNIRGTNYVYNLNPEVNYEPNLPHMAGYFYIAAQLTIDVFGDIVTRKA